MRKRLIGIAAAMLVCVLAVACLCTAVLREDPAWGNDTVALNALCRELGARWSTLMAGEAPPQGIAGGYAAYTVLDLDGGLVYSTGDAAPQTLAQAYRQGDLVCDIVHKDQIVGRVLVYSGLKDALTAQKTQVALLCAAALLVTLLGGGMLYLYLRRVLLVPFSRMQSFAHAVAGGDLDAPLQMDRGNVFGAFTESFDLMREELRTAKEREREAAVSKKELVAQLSHDIKTPVASIKAVTEVLAVKAADAQTQAQLQIILSKADQINTLVTNLFHATLEELQELAVTPTEQESTCLAELIREADYEHRVEMNEPPQAMLLLDKLRLAQVLDNLLANSYKYAATPIHIRFGMEQEQYTILFCDEGEGVSEQERPLLTQKYYRAGNAAGKSGAGLGLYISGYLMKMMGGTLQVLPPQAPYLGFAVLLTLRLAK